MATRIDEDELLLARVEHKIRNGQQHIANQIAAIERLQSTAQGLSFAKEILETLRRCQAMYYAHRDRLRSEIKREAITAKLLEQSRVAVAESKQLLDNLQAPQSGQWALGSPLHALASQDRSKEPP